MTEAPVATEAAVPEHEVTATPKRGRVVMLTDNAVEGDSRVQKTARSVAEAGWEVILLGRQGGDTPNNWWIGDAEVRLLPVPANLVFAPYVYRRALLRRPLAYPPGRSIGYRLDAVRARRADVTARLAALRVARRAGSNRMRDTVGRVALLPARAVTKAMSLWVNLRVRQTKQLREVRKDTTAFLNTAPIRIWSTLYGARAWRRLDPSLWQWELSFAKTIDQLKPDMIHAHDFKMVGVGARATMRARAKGRRVSFIWDAHELVSGIMPRPTNARWLPAQVAHVREYAPVADSVVTVSPTLADMLREIHHLTEQPTVVLNTPVRAPAGDPAPDLRGMCGIDRDVPLLVYCGGVNARRGLDLMVDALVRLEKAHVAFVTLHPSGVNAASEALLTRAESIGVADRVHLLPYVEHWQVAAFLSTADVGIIPIQHQPNHEIALITKFFEYSHARLPIVVSDVRTMAEAVRSTGQGEVFRAEDLDDYVRAVELVLADPDRYRSAYDRDGLLENWTWEAQARILDDLYGRLLPHLPGRETSSPQI